MVITCHLGVNSIPLESIPGIRETGWRPAARATRGAQQMEESQDIDVLANMLRNVLNAVSFITFLYSFKHVFFVVHFHYISLQF